MKINIPEVLVHLRQIGPKPVTERAAMRAVACVMRDRRRYAAALRAARRGGCASAQGQSTPPAVAAIGVDGQPRRAAAGQADLPGMVDTGTAESMSARDEVLARIRLARPVAPVDVPRDYDRGEDGPSPVDLFVERVADYKATVRRCAPDGIAEAVSALLDGVPGIVVPPGVPGDWLASYPGRIARDDGLTVADLDAPGLAVVTGCAVGIADDRHARAGRRSRPGPPGAHAGAGPPRLRDPRRPDRPWRARRARARCAEPTRPLTFVSGPSATSDIELNRVEGVHGPRRLDVVVCG